MRAPDGRRRPSLWTLLLATAILAVSPAVARADEIATVVTLESTPDPISPGYLPHLTATVATVDGGALPAGTLTISHEDGQVVVSGPANEAQPTVSGWGFGVAGYGDVTYTAVYASTEGGAPSSASVVVHYRDLVAPWVSIGNPGWESWFGTPEVSLEFTISEPASAECRLDLEPWAPCTSPLSRSLPDGAHAWRVRAIDFAGNLGPETERSFVVDTTPPTGSVRFLEGPGPVRLPLVTVDAVGVDDREGIGTVFLAFSDEVDPVTGRLTALPYGPRLLRPDNAGRVITSLDLTNVFAGGRDADGVHHVFVQFQTSRLGQDSPVYGASIVLDRIGPTISKPSVAPASSGTAPPGGVPVRLTFHGSDDRTGVSAYQVERRIGTGGWLRILESTRTEVIVAAATGSSTTFRVRALDGAGNPSTWATSGVVAGLAISEQSASVAYRGTWRVSPSSVSVGGALAWTTTARARAQVTFTGRSVAWIAVVGPTRGRASVFVDGILARTVDLHSSTTGIRRIVFARTWSRSSTHSLTIVAVGGANGRVDVDGFAVVR